MCRTLTLHPLHPLELEYDGRTNLDPPDHSRRVHPLDPLRCHLDVVAAGWRPLVRRVSCHRRPGLRSAALEGLSALRCWTADDLEELPELQVLQ